MRQMQQTRPNNDLRITSPPAVGASNQPANNAGNRDTENTLPLNKEVLDGNPWSGTSQNMLDEGGNPPTEAVDQLAHGTMGHQDDSEFNKNTLELLM